MKYYNGEKLESEYVRDNLVGEGKYYWTNGDKYYGSFNDDKEMGELHKVDG